MPQLRLFFFSIFQEGFSGENEAETFCCDNSGSTQSLGCLLTSLPSLSFPQGGNFCPLVSLLRKVFFCFKCSRIMCQEVNKIMETKQDDKWRWSLPEFPYPVT